MLNWFSLGYRGLLSAEIKTLESSTYNVPKIVLNLTDARHSYWLSRIQKGKPQKKIFNTCTKYQIAWSAKPIPEGGILTVGVVMALLISCNLKKNSKWLAVNTELKTKRDSDKRQRYIYYIFLKWYRILRGTTSFVHISFV